MKIHFEEIAQVLTVLTEDKNLCFQLKKNVKASATGTATAAVPLFLGGVLLGPIGLLLGGVAGSVAAYAMSEDFQPLYQIVEDMDSKTLKQLKIHLQKVISDIEIKDLEALVKALRSPKSDTRAAVIKGITVFFSTLDI